MIPTDNQLNFPLEAEEAPYHWMTSQGLAPHILRPQLSRNQQAHRIIEERVIVYFGNWGYLTQQTIICPNQGEHQRYILYV